MAELILTEVRKSFRDDQGREVRAAAGVSLIVETGELLALVGPSGCGKSTLLRLIAGLEVADGGTISLAGRVLNDMPPADRDVAMVFQNYALFPHLTVAGNIAFGLKFRGASKAQIHDAVREAAALLQLEGLLDRKPHALSGGQRQRVALGRAMVRRPKVFLLDEPLSNLDARLRAEMRSEIARLHERLKTTMIFVTHDQTEAMTLGQRVCVLHEGRVMQAGPPLEIYRRPANVFVAEFIGSPGMNLLRGTLTTGANRTVFRVNSGSGQPFDIFLEGELPARAAERPVLLGVRPEDFELSPAADAFAAQVEIVEPLGHETILHVAAGGQRLVIRTRDAGPFAPRQELRLRCRAGRASFFDPQTRDAIG